jgi:hypothetical protein
VTILAPPDGTSTNSQATFSWKPDVPLLEGQVFEVAFWKVGAPRDTAQAWTEASSTESQQITPGNRVGSYQWGVWLGAFDSAGKYEKIRYLGGGNKFVVPENSGSNEDSDGGTPGNSNGDETQEK